MATDQEVEIFRNLRSKWFSKEKAKEVVLEIRSRQQQPVETKTPTPAPTEPVRPTIDLGLEKPMTPVESQEPTFLDTLKEWALATPWLDLVSSALTEWWKPLVEKWQEFMQEAQAEKAPAVESAPLFSAQTWADLAANFLPDAKETLWEVITMVWDIPWTLWALLSNAKAISKWWLDAKFEWTFLEWVFDPTKEDKEIQDAFIWNMQDVFINKETWELKNVEELSDEAKKHVRENPFVFLSGILKIWNKINRQRPWQLEKAAELNEQAKDLVTKAIHATGKNSKIEAEKIAQQVVDKWLIWTPEDLIAKSYTELNKLYPELNKIKPELWWEIDVDQLIKIITDFEDKITSPKWWRLPSMKLEWKDLDLLTDDLFEFLDNNWKLTEQLWLDLRDFLRKDYKEWEISNDIQKLRQSMWDNIAKQLNMDNPDLAKINAQVSFYTILKDLLEETKLRKSSQAWWVDTTKNASLRLLSWAVWTWIASMLWWSQILWTIVWLAMWDRFIALVNSPKYKLAKANNKKKLADALIRWDKKSFEQAMDAIIISQWIWTEEEIKEALERSAWTSDVNEMLKSSWLRIK